MKWGSWGYWSEFAIFPFSSVGSASYQDHHYPRGGSSGWRCAQRCLLCGHQQRWRVAADSSWRRSSFICSSVTSFLLAGFVSLFRIRTIMKHDGTKTEKLEKLMGRNWHFQRPLHGSSHYRDSVLFLRTGLSGSVGADVERSTCKTYAVPCPEHNPQMNPDFTCSWSSTWWPWSWASRLDSGYGLERRLTRGGSSTRDWRTPNKEKQQCDLTAFLLFTFSDGDNNCLKDALRVVHKLCDFL